MVLFLAALAAAGVAKVISQGGGGSAKRAAAVQAQKQAEAADIIKQQYEQTAQQYQPYQEAGTNALGQYQGLLPGLGAPTQELYSIAQQQDPIVQQIREGNYQQSPGYQFRLGEGQKVLENSASARGGLLSGAAGKALTQYGQNFATSEYDNYINRLRAQLGDVGTQLLGRGTALQGQYNQLNAYSPLINTGYNATSSLGLLGAEAAQGRAGYTAGVGTSFAQGIRDKAAQVNRQRETGAQVFGQVLGAAAGGGGAGGALSGVLGSFGGAK